MGQCGVRRRSRGRAKLAGPRSARAARARGRAAGGRGGDRGADRDGCSISSRMLLHAKARYAEAEPLYRRALAIAEESLGPDRSQSWRSASTISRACSGTRTASARRSRFIAARWRSTRRAWAGSSRRGDRPQQSRELAPRHEPSQPRRSRSIAARWRSTRRATGRIIPMWRSASTISQDLLQETNRLARPSRSIAARSRSTRRATGRIIHTWRQASTISRACSEDTNRLGEAEPLYRRALAIDEASYGPDHPRCGDHPRQSRGPAPSYEPSQARPNRLYRRALAIDEASYGPDHPDVASDLNNLAMLLKSDKPTRRGRVAFSSRAGDLRKEPRSGSSEYRDHSQEPRRARGRARVERGRRMAEERILCSAVRKALRQKRGARSKDISAGGQMASTDFWAEDFDGLNDPSRRRAARD